MRPFDISPFGLPNCPEGEIWFEEPRDISRVVVNFAGAPPNRVRVAYLQGVWPQERFELWPDLYGRHERDDHFRTAWRDAAIRTTHTGTRSLTITFKGLRQEFPRDPLVRGYDVPFRRTLGVRVTAPRTARVRRIRVYTRSPRARTRLRVELDAGRKTAGRTIELCGYNAVVRKITAGTGTSVKGRGLRLRPAKDRTFHIDVDHMAPTSPHSYDAGLITFGVGRETFTISLESLREQGPVWYPKAGVYIAPASDKSSFREYRERIRDHRTVSARVLQMPEQSFAGAFHGQPRPHAVACSVGCKYAAQRFWIEPNGDVVLHPDGTVGKAAARFCNEGPARFFFRLERWRVCGRYPDPAPVLAYNLHFERGAIQVQQKVLAVPLSGSFPDGELAADDSVVGLVRFRFRNTGDAAGIAELPVAYASHSRRSLNRIQEAPETPPTQDDCEVPLSGRVLLSVRAGRMESKWQGKDVLRCCYVSNMEASGGDTAVVLRRPLEPGETCECILKIPHIPLTSQEDLDALDGLDFDRCHGQVQSFWLAEGQRGAQLQVPEPHLNDLHKSHLAHVAVTDAKYADDPRLIGTSVGTSTYANFANEACMIIQDLDQRGLHEEARRRLEVWLKYQGTVGLLGNFTDHEGVFHGAGGQEALASYNQNHGWVLWCLAEHYFLTRDAQWFMQIADQVIRGCDWVFRQRRNTMKALPHSRGWEWGFLPAGGLEDPHDHHYWLATNGMTWRGVEWAARALEATGHPQAGRIRKEADAFRGDLVRGFETARAHSPLVRLRDGRWVPHYPSRLYCRGREPGWIYETLEGSIYLLLSGLYDPNSREAGWILDDYQDNRYTTPPWGFVLTQPYLQWFDRGGFSIQPNLLAGLLPHLERDEIKVFLRMFFNAWCACYREEVGAMVEHPMPELGFSNAAHPKTSDEANAVMWLRYLFVYAFDGTLHIGRAVPRRWLADGEVCGLQGVRTVFGKVSVRYASDVASGTIRADVRLDLHTSPVRVLVRFRHPDGRPIRSVTVNGEPRDRFDADRGDVEISGLTGKITVVACFA